jgi:hypothetical protein
MWVKGTSSSSSNLNVTWRNAHASGTDGVNIDLTKPIPVTTTWTRVTATFVITANINANNLVLDLEWQLPAGGKITGVQLEEGTVATTFEHRPAGLELSLCYRYCELMSNVSSAYVSPGAGYNSLYRAFIPFMVTKRATPSVTTYGIGGYPNNAGSMDTDGVGNDAISVSARIGGFQISGIGSPYSGQFAWKAEAEL